MCLIVTELVVAATGGVLVNGGVGEIGEWMRIAFVHSVVVALD